MAAVCGKMQQKGRLKPDLGFRRPFALGLTVYFAAEAPAFAAEAAVALAAEAVEAASAFAPAAAFSPQAAGYL